MMRSPDSRIYFSKIENTPIGNLWVACSERGLVAVEWGIKKNIFTEKLAKGLKASLEEDARKLVQTRKEVREYLVGERRNFSLKIDWSQMRPFQREALLATFAIPYGQTLSYGEIAMQIGHPRAARAIGRAEATNPMPLVIPCHRVLGADGKLRGYGGGLEIKRWLLKMEGAVLI